MKKPKIIILMHYMELGGAESALLGLLQSIDPKRVDVDLFLYDKRGPLMEYIPDKVNVLPLIKEYTMLERPLTKVMMSGCVGVAMMRLFGKIKTRLYAGNNSKGLDNASGFTYQQYHTVKVLPNINNNVEYDLAISFMTPHYIVLDKVRAKKKMGWVHTDYTNIFINCNKELRMWDGLDYIAGVSEEVVTNFGCVFPALKDKLLTIENILSPDYVRRRAEENIINEVMKEDRIIKLLSIGRYCNQKRFDEVGSICRNVVETMVEMRCEKKIHWYIIGYGSQEEEDKIRQNIEKLDVKEFITLLGKKDNPYPYIKSCDVYIQPSRYEGKSITVREAQILCKPVVVTNYPTAPSQINDGVDGVIVPMENDECAKGIVEFLKDTDKQKRIVEYLQTHDYGNESEVEKVYELCEG